MAQRTGFYKRLRDWLKTGSLRKVSKVAYITLTELELLLMRAADRLTCKRDPHARLAVDKATIIIKSFERPKSLLRLIKSIQHHYPGIKIVVADDSATPPQLPDNVELIQLAFNSGISRGLNAALARVESEYTVRLDDDMYICRKTRIGAIIAFMEECRRVDLCGFRYINVPLELRKSAKKQFREYLSYKLEPAKVAETRGTAIGDFTVMEKVPNIYVARTGKLREVAWDDNIRMIDHHDFFCRAKGVIVSAYSTDFVLWHLRTPYNLKYMRYRMDFAKDMLYIRTRNAKKKV